MPSSIQPQGFVSRRRLLVAAAAAGALPALSPRSARAQSGATVRIGYQKFNTLNILKGTGSLEAAFQSQGVSVEWREFLGGAQLTEALVAGAIDFGHASDGVSVFQQASGKGLVYLAAESPYPKGVGFLVARDSPIRTVGDLKGRRVATGKGYNTQFILIRALAAAGLAYEDIDPVYVVTASDTVAALQSRSVDAIGLWDPFLASAQLATDSRLLFDGQGLSGNRTYHLAKPEWAQSHQATLKTIFTELRKANQWAQAHPKEVVEILAPQLKVDPAVLALATERRQYGVVPLTPAIAQEQQTLADVLAELHLIPRKIQVEDAFLSLPVL